MSKFSGKGLLSGVGALFKLVFTLRGAVAITLILLLVTSWSAFTQARAEGDPAPFFKILGGEIIGHDVKLYEDSRLIIDQGGLVSGDDLGWWGKLKANFGLFSRLFTNLWYLYTVMKLFYALASSFNDSAKITSVLLAVAFVAALQIGGNYYLDSPGDDLIPFKGLVEFTRAVPLLLHHVVPDVVSVNDSLNVSSVGEDVVRSDFIIDMVGNA